MRRFDGGPGFIARLCPVDYHRFHFPDSGKVISETRLTGPLHSVNPVALAARGDLLFRNERVVTVIETENFGAIAYVEVGAICVGKIVQTYGDPSRVERGEEKGYFLFGGSTVIVIGEAGKFTIDSDLLAKSREGTECLIRLGEGIATGAKRL
jgi:phosphatidylserine decarboxylase